MTKPRVLVLGRAITDTDEYREFCQVVEPVFYIFESRDSFIKDLQDKLNDICGIWVAQGGFFSVKTNEGVTLDKEIVSLLPQTLKVIAVCSIGYDRYDVQAMKERGIVLCNTPALAADQVADTLLYHVLNCFRFYNFFDKAFRMTSSTSKARNLAASKTLDPETGFPLEADPNQAFRLGDEVNTKIVRTPKGQVAGIIGLGDIGQELLKRLHCIGMKIHYCKRSPLTESELKKLGGIPLVYHKEFESILPMVDVLVFCVPLNNHTKHMLNHEMLARCKDGVRVVNIGRGATINQQDLLLLLKSGKVSYAGLDVFDDEPNVDPELVKRMVISTTPHIGSSTLDNRILSSELCQQNIVNVLIDGGEGLTLVI